MLIKCSASCVEFLCSFTVGHGGNLPFQVPEYEYPKDSVPDYLSILVPNVDNVRTDFLIDVIAKQGKAVLLIGEQVSSSEKLLQTKLYAMYSFFVLSFS